MNGKLSTGAVIGIGAAMVFITGGRGLEPELPVDPT